MRTRLDKRMKETFKEVYEESKKEKVGMRTMSYIKALENLEYVYKTRFN